ncbi:hypothetical protein V518_2631 [Thermoanaerobacterium aotearoense SCUT27]|uniref:Uncharacterized protein n=3 Tax=Thermoanaerobacterium TaxID=28895 RepID=L0INC3_THETR|nr:hypothetical protein Tsac_2763 [Thermoanaerobacterium saccharolyticum JW/SL-YS485]AGB20348.1 hypothetical protein Thethe_02794 [Thermoanaerobacterium thermosaccharolyticum M0795]ETO37226.1 hypothetical protein V518_2631 [Thermoanaerobacterium aotearoense SCUT27]
MNKNKWVQRILYLVAGLALGSLIYYLTLVIK